MKRFKKLKVEFKPEVMNEVVQKLISEFELVDSTELPNTKINLPTAEEVLNNFDEAIGNSRKRIELKGLRRRQQAEKCAQDEEKHQRKAHIRLVIVDLLMDAETREVAHVESNHEAALEDGAMDTSEWNDRDVVESGHPPTDVRGHGPISPIMETPISSESNFSVNDNFDVATPERMDISAKEETEDCSVDHKLVENVLKPAKSPQETLMNSTDPQDVGDKPEDEDQDLLEAVQNGVDLANMLHSQSTKFKMENWTSFPVIFTTRSLYVVLHT
ncbi:unnamed protein product [Caenorhabditis brenneri]